MEKTENKNWDDLPLATKKRRCEFDDLIVCPHCGTERTHLDMDWPGEGETEIACDVCEKTFALTVHVSVDFTTSPVGGWKE